MIMKAVKRKRMAVLKRKTHQQKIRKTKAKRKREIRRRKEVHDLI
jgi:hypothetical protein